MSWPPSTKSFQGARSREANRGNWLTRPASPMSPFERATRPTVVVEATPPLAPISQTPIRERAMDLGGSFQPEGTDRRAGRRAEGKDPIRRLLSAGNDLRRPDACQLVRRSAVDLPQRLVEGRPPAQGGEQRRVLAAARHQEIGEAVVQYGRVLRRQGPRQEVVRLFRLPQEGRHALVPPLDEGILGIHPGP